MHANQWSYCLHLNYHLCHCLEQCSNCLHTFASLSICKSMFRNVLAGIFFLYNWTVQRCHCLAQLALWTWSRLKIFCWCWWSLSLGWISGLSSDCCPDNFRKHTHGHMHALDEHISPCTHCEASVPVWPTLIILSLSNRWRASPDVICVVGLCSEAAFRTQGELAGNMPDLQVSCPIIDIK